jgi:hypothetical protein
VIGLVARRHPIGTLEMSQVEDRVWRHVIVCELVEIVLQSRRRLCHPRPTQAREGRMKETRKVHYVKGVFVCPKCRQSYVQEKWIEEWRVRCHKCDYRGTLTEVSVEERMEEEIVRR